MEDKEVPRVYINDERATKCMFKGTPYCIFSGCNHDPEHEMKFRRMCCDCVMIDKKYCASIVFSDTTKH